MKGLKFEKFKVQRGGSKGESLISIHKTGRIAFSTGFIKENNFSNPLYLGLSFANDENNFYMGFSFEKSKEEGMLKVYLPKNHGLVSCPKFFNKYKISLEKVSGKYKPEKHKDNELGELFVITMKREERESDDSFTKE